MGNLRRLTITLLALSVVILSACSKEATAKRKLKKLNIDITTSSFLEQVQSGNIEAVGLLLTAGIDPKTIDVTGVSSVILAVNGGHGAIIPMLLNKGVNIKAKDSKGWTPILHAIEAGNKEIVQLLIEDGADVNDGPDNDKPLMLAVERGSIDIVQLLLRKGANINIQDTSGLTVLIDAVEHHHTDIALSLIDNGADVHAKTNIGKTALMSAAKAGNVELVKKMIEKGADVNVRDNNNSTPLIKAAIGGNVAVVQLLLDNGADVNSKTKDGAQGVSAVLSAAVCDHSDLLELLKKAGATDRVLNPPMAMLFENPSIIEVLKECIGEVPVKSDYAGQTHLKYLDSGIELAFYIDTKLRFINLYSGDYQSSTTKSKERSEEENEFRNQYKGVIPLGLKFSYNEKEVKKLLGRPSRIGGSYDDLYIYEYPNYKLIIWFNFKNIWRVSLVRKTDSFW